MNASPARYISSTEAECLTPRNKPELVEVSFTLNGDDFFTGTEHNVVNFAFELTEVVTSIYPLMGDSAGGTKVVVSGSGFVNSPSLKCKFGNVESSISTAAEFISTNAVQCTSPPMSEHTIAVNRRYPQERSDSGSASNFVLSVSNNGLDFSTDVVKFTYVDASVVATVNPSVVPEQAEDIKLLVSGSNFVNSRHLKCFYSVKSDSWWTNGLWLSDQLVQCATPSNLTYAMNNQLTLSISNNGELAGASNNNALLSVRTNELTLEDDFSPTIGSVEGNTPVTITLQHNIPVTAESSCMFGNVKVPMMKVTPTDMVCRAPPNSKVGEVDLSFTSDGIHWNRVGKYVYVLAPVVQSIQPALGPNGGGTVVTVTGSNLGNTVACRFASIIVAATNPTSSSVECVSPANQFGENGEVMVLVEVTSNLFDFTNEEMLYVFYQESMARIMNLSPSSGPANGNSTVVVHGRGFVNSKYLKCRFGEELTSHDAFNNVVEARWISSEELACVTPLAKNNGNAVVYLSFNGVDFFTQPNSKFVFDAPVQISSIAPSVGAVRGGTRVVAVGSNFRFTGSVKCRFGFTVVKATFLSEQQISCVAPASKNGAAQVDFLISLNGVDFENAHTSEVAKFDYVSTPEIQSISPNTGWRSGGTQLTLTTKNVYTHSGVGIWCAFNGHTNRAVNFNSNNMNDVLVAASMISDTQVVCTTPPQTDFQASTQSISLVYDEEVVEFDSASPTFEYIDAMLVDRVVPTSGSILGGSFVSVYGESFVNEYDLVCVWTANDGDEDDADAAASVEITSLAEFVNVNTLRCKTPSAEAAGAGNFLVTIRSLTDSARTYRSVTNFEFYPEPFVSLLSPSSGSKSGGTIVTVTGFNFAKPTTNHLSQIMCRFGKNSYPVSGKIISGSMHSIECVSPMQQLGHRSSGSSLVDLEISLNGGFDWTTSEIAYEYTSSTYVSGIVPESGSHAGGGGVVVTVADGATLGMAESNFLSNLEKASDIWCHFGVATPVLGKILGRNDDNSVNIECVSPSSLSFAVQSLFGVNLEISVNGGNDKTSSRKVFTYFPKPYVAMITPVSGVKTGGDLITVVGARFVDDNSLALSCKFLWESDPDGYFSTSKASFIDAGKLTCRSPPHVSGKGDVVGVSVLVNGGEYEASNFADISPQRFTYLNLPSVSSITPDVVSDRGGNVVSLLGKNLGSVVACKFGSRGGYSPVLNVVGDSQIDCVVTKSRDIDHLGGNDAANLSVYLSRGDKAGFVDSGLTVALTKYLESTTGDDFAASLNEVKTMPTVQSIAPQRTSSSIPIWITLRGDNFVNTENLSCLFNANSENGGVSSFVGESIFISKVSERSEASLDEDGKYMRATTKLTLFSFFLLARLGAERDKVLDAQAFTRSCHGGGEERRQRKRQQQRQSLRLHR